MNGEMNQDEMREAIFDALYEYEVHKKKRRLKAVENALRGTVMATVVGSAGLSLAGNDRENPGREIVVAMLSSPNPVKETQQTQIFEGAVHFETGQHILTETKKNQLLTVINTISKDAVVTVMGHTDAIGDNAYNHKLGMRRAQAVAGFLSEHGIKINGVGNQLAENNKMGWREQRVDLIINVASATKPAEPASTPKTTPAPEINPQPEAAALAKAETTTETKPQPAAAASPQVAAVPETSSPTQTAGLAQVETAPEIKPQPAAIPSPQVAAVPEIKSPPQPAATSRIAPVPEAMPGMPEPAGTEAPQQQASAADAVPSEQASNAAAETHLIKGAVHFAFDKHLLTSEHKVKLLAVIKGLPQNAEISVIGRTDALGVRTYNEKLGIDRADAVANFLKKHGVKIKQISNQLADNNKMGWRERRVDLILNEVATAATQELPQTVNAGPQLSSDSGLTHETGKAAMKQRRQVFGVVHFGFDQHALVRAHRERLLEFLKQIPKDAELTIIGRTDPSGKDAYNMLLGLKRANSVANYLAHLGIKVKKIGSKVSRNMPTGWHARRVDILVESDREIKPIHLSQPFEHKTGLQVQSGAMG